MNSPLLQQEIIEKILEEVDSDIREIMLRTECIQDFDMEKVSKEVIEAHTYKGYQLLSDPSNTILNWQTLRDRKKHG